MKREAREGLVLLFVLAALAAVCLISKDRPLLMDENTNYPQIEKFFRRDFSLLPHLAVMPGYHAAVASIARVSGISSPSFARLISFGMGLLAFLLFYLSARELAREDAVWRTLQWVLCPVTLPFLYLIYTDFLSLALVLAVFWASQRRAYGAAGILGLMAIAVRQSNVAWILFTILWDRADKGTRARKAFPLWIGLISFGVFVVWNGSVVIGGREAHPNGGLSATSVIFGLFAAAMLAFPLVLDRGTEIFRRLTRYPVLWAVWPLLVLAFWTGHRHLYNSISIIDSVWVLRNLVLIEAYQGVIPLVLIGGAAFFAGLLLWACPLGRRADYLIFPFSAAFLFLHTLVEPRYLFIPIVFWQLFRKRGSSRAEIFLLLLWTVLSTVLLYGVIQHSWIA